MKQFEWKHGTLMSIEIKFALMMSWSITIHKYQGHTLEMEIINLGNIKKCAGVTLVALSCVKKLVNMLLQSFLYEQLKKVNKSNQSSIIRSAIQALNSKFEVKKIRFSNLWNHQ